jgi:vancomycin permeability regulator SanA
MFQLQVFDGALNCEEQSMLITKQYHLNRAYWILKATLPSVSGGLSQNHIHAAYFGFI